VSVTLRPMTAAEYEEFARDGTDEYIRQLVDAGGWTEAQARLKADADFARFLPDGLATPGQHLTVVIDDESGDTVGRLWFAERELHGATHLYLFDITVAPAYRGRGWGRALMLALEDEARRLGVGEIRLNVFGGNEVARGLYRSLGYGEAAVEMTKQV
jgi:ribosomal protein S18 acetylase RimI-like enzyme